jgi:hypothetical protein
MRERGPRDEGDHDREERERKGRNVARETRLLAHTMSNHAGYLSLMERGLFLPQAGTGTTHRGGIVVTGGLAVSLQWRRPSFNAS